jgi:hypothetical protein
MSDPLEGEALRWWDGLAAAGRSKRDEFLFQIGREGELLSLNRERKRLVEEGFGTLEVRWIAPEDASAGFDIQSWMRLPDGSVGDLHIEVKAYRGSRMRFFLTRNEWDTALRFAACFEFHVWSLDSEELTIISVNRVRKHVPADRGLGQWRLVEIEAAPGEARLSSE